MTIAGRQIVVAGSGKMARDVGMFFLGRGHAVAWLSRDGDRLEALERWVHKRMTRLVSLMPDWSPGVPRFFVVGDPAVPAADVFTECINEAEEEKQALLKALDGVIPADALRLSNSSSILPVVVHPGCAGLHFFYPVELTGFVEAVFPEGYAAADRERILALLHDSELECIEEAPQAAFAINRLLLPVQNECFRALMAGVSAEEVDRATVSPVLPLGQLVLMDNIGLDVVHPAVCNFTARMPLELGRQYAPLDDGLRQLLAMGKRGHKNRDGLRLGAPLPWPTRADRGRDPGPPLGEMFQALFVNTCCHAIEQGLLSPRDLDLALCSLFGWDRPLEDAWEPIGPSRAREVLDEAYERSGSWYFIPARGLSGRTGGGADAPERGPVI